MNIHPQKNEEKLKIGIQKSGRLTDETSALLKKSGLEFNMTGNHLFAICQDFDAEIYFLRDEDIRNYVSIGRLDLGIVGQNLLYEYGSNNLEQLLKLGFGGCSLVIAVPEDSSYKIVGDLNGKK